MFESGMKLPRLVLPVLVLGAVAAGLFLARTAEAREADTARGWTVHQGGVTITYPFADRWTATATQTGMTLENGKTGEKVYYYGTFRVIERTRDIK